MLTEQCKECKFKHFNNYRCSNCGQRYGGMWPTMSYHTSSSDKNHNKNMKYCPMCGHKFKKPKVME